ncbi:hypothetical protein ABES03_24815 [Neobacillus rhizosphaerae]|uniref:hypothetical protein n=1 Tax=Neobacillus rhizosphaerae TaxID=2880965 RepID=UPI003D26F21C
MSRRRGKERRNDHVEAAMSPNRGKERGNGRVEGVYEPEQREKMRKRSRRSSL